MGYGAEFGWLSTVNVTSRRQATEISSHIPAETRSVFFALCLFASLNPQNFDYKIARDFSLRMTYSGFAWVLSVRKKRAIRESPLQGNI